MNVGKRLVAQVGCPRHLFQPELTNAPCDGRRGRRAKRAAVARSEAGGEASCRKRSHGVGGVGVVVVKGRQRGGRGEVGSWVVVALLIGG